MPVTLHAPGALSLREIDPDLETPFREAFRLSRTAMLLTDPHRPDNPVAFANAAFSALTGYAAEEVVGCNCRFLQGPETDRATVDALRIAIEAGEAIAVEILNYRKDGTPFWNALSINPIRNRAGDVTHHFATCSDITDRKRNEAELQKLRDEKAGQRIEALQAALERRSALLHEVDHRAKNSLQVVSSLVLLKARRMQDAQARAALQGLAERIGALSTVHRLLSPADDTGRLGLNDFVSDLLADLVASQPPGQIALDVEVEPVEIGAGKAVPLALLVNELVTNVVQHAFPDRATGRLAVRVARFGPDLRIVIQDDGIGLAGGALPEGGFGKTLIDMLVRQLRARIAWDDAAPGTRVVVTMPLQGGDIV